MTPHSPIHTLTVVVLIVSLAVTPGLAAATTPTVFVSHSVAASTPAADLGQSTPALADRETLEAWLDETMADQLERHHVPGAAVVVVRDGDLFLAKGYGYADLATGRPVVANETVFGIGSTSKLLTWTAVMQGVEAGRLDLDRDVNDYLTDSPVSIPATYPEPITLEHLGTHTAGFEDSFDGTLVADPAAVRPLGETLAAAQPARVRPPGQFVAYSNYGTALAGHVVAEQSDTAFTSYVQARILDPLGMADTTYEQPVPERLRPRLATGYVYRDGQFRPDTARTWGLAPQGGAMRSTPTDMGRFMLAHLPADRPDAGPTRILAPETVRTMHQRHVTKVPAVPELNGMAYGFIEMDNNGERVVGHWGTTARFMSLLALFPERDVGLFVVYNSAGGAPARFELFDAFVDRYYPRSAVPIVDPPAGAAERAAALAGDYRSLTVSETSWHRVLGVATRTVSVEATDDGSLTTSRLGGPTRTWVERRPGIYEGVGDDDLLVFAFDDRGRATHLYFGSFGPSTYERVPWGESLPVTASVLGGGALAFGLGVLVWGARPLWRRLRGVGGRDPGRRSRIEWALLGGSSLLWLTVMTVFAAAWLNFDAEVAAPSLALQAGLWLRYVALAGTAGVVVTTALAWRTGRWSLRSRLFYTGIAAVGLLVVWQLSLLRILPV
jgi:CubicO group peptidase (beta-lactamase class C family)